MFSDSEQKPCLKYRANGRQMSYWLLVDKNRVKKVGHVVKHNCHLFASWSKTYPFTWNIVQIQITKFLTNWEKRWLCYSNSLATFFWGKKSLIFWTILAPACSFPFFCFFDFALNQSNPRGLGFSLGGFFSEDSVFTTLIFSVHISLHSWDCR